MAVHVLDVCLAGLASCLLVHLTWRRGPPLPPRPPGWPLIGNLLDLRVEAPYKTIGALTTKYGPIIYFNVMGRQIVFLNSLEAAKDLLNKMSQITSNRPQSMLGGELVGLSSSTILLQYGDTLRKHRKLLTQHIGIKSSLATFYLAEEAEAKQFVCSVLRNHDDLHANCRRTTASCILRISHGYNITDDVTQIANTARHIIPETLTIGRHLVEFLPILRYLPAWFPGCGFHKNVKRWRKMVNDTVNKPHEFVLEQLAKGDALPSLSSRVLQQGPTPEDEEILKWASFSVLLAASDSLSSMLLGFFRAMTMYPEILKRAQAEIDAVVGNDRLPTMEDCDALPYVNAICMEILRWNVVGPITVRVNTQDIIYEGYFIPKGTWLMSNIWFILSDPKTYPDPERFDPERFLGENQQPDPRGACFGWGRRSCPGARLTQSMLFIYVAMALATLDVSRHVENGVECVPRYEFEEGVTRRVKPFKCKITARSKKVEGLLQA